MANMITRTFTGYNVKFAVLNAKGEVNEEVVYIGVNDREKAVRKATAMMAGKGILKDAEYVEELRGLEVDEFYKLSKTVNRPPSQQKKIDG